MAGETAPLRVRESLADGFQKHCHGDSADAEIELDKKCLTSLTQASGFYSGPEPERATSQLSDKRAASQHFRAGLGISRL